MDTAKIQAAVDVLREHCVTTGRASEILGVGERHVRWYITQGHLPRIEIAGVYLVPVDALMRLMNNRPKAGRPSASS